MCKLLIENGLPANHQDSNKKTALFWSKKNKDTHDYLQSVIKSKEKKITPK